MSGLYNMVAGVHPMAGPILASLGIDPSTVERLRDAYLVKQGDVLVCEILCRTGGGNRESYPNETLTMHPLYLRDEDDSYDSTYAHYYFTLPDMLAHAIAEITATGVSLDSLVEPRTMQQKFETAIAALEAGPPKKDEE